MTTKYNVHDLIWGNFNAQSNSAYIYEIRITSNAILYKLYIEGKYKYFKEEELFPSKEELLNSFLI